MFTGRRERARAGARSGGLGTGKSHLLVALGHAAIEAGFRVRYFRAIELVETLYRGLADNSVGRVLEGIPKADLILIDEIGFAPMDHTRAELFFGLVAAAYERRSLLSDLVAFKQRRRDARRATLAEMTATRPSTAFTNRPFRRGGRYYAEEGTPGGHTLG